MGNVQLSIKDFQPLGHVIAEPRFKTKFRCLNNFWLIKKLHQQKNSIDTVRLNPLQRPVEHFFKVTGLHSTCQIQHRSGRMADQHEVLIHQRFNA